MNNDSDSLELENEKLKNKIEKLKKINLKLMDRVEQNTDKTGEAMVLFQNAIDLERKVNERTQKLETATKGLEKSNQELLKAKEEAEAATVAKSQFLATMSHEIRTPMNGLIGVLALLEEDLPEAKRKLMKTAQNCAENLLVLINDILDFSKIEAGKMEVENSIFNPLELLEEVCELHSSTAYGKSLELICKSDPGYDFSAYSDAHRLRQIVSNLVSNAIKFTETGEVSTYFAHRATPEGTPLLHFEVSDSGIGISEKAQKKLFKAFSQENSSTTRDFGGTGLGLTISKKLVELMGGEIHLESIKGQGSTFSFDIPQNDYPKKAKIPQELERLNESNILVIESNRIARRNLVTWLEYFGCVVEAVDSLKLAFDTIKEKSLCKSFQYDWVFVDKQRIESHFDQWHEIRSEAFAIKSSKIVILQRSAFDANLTEYDDTQIVLPKPISIAQLINVFEGKKLKTNNSPQEGNSAKTKHKGLQVLVVDDNITNRMIASQLLQQKHHLTPDTANTGKEAIRAISQKKYDLVFMDCMMPEMDGYDASKAIRKGDAGEDNKNIPIIALTANAMSGDREVCLAAGMSDYIPKPIRPIDLAKALETWDLRNQEKPSQTIDLEQVISEKTEDPHQHYSEKQISPSLTPSNSSHKPIFDPNRLVEMYDGDTDIVNSLLEVFLESMADTMNKLQEAVEKADDHEKVRFYAHRMKGSSADYGASQLRSLSHKMEDLCVNQKLSEAINLYPHVHEISTKTKVAISEFMKK